MKCSTSTYFQSVHINIRTLSPNSNANLPREVIGSIHASSFLLPFLFSLPKVVYLNSIGVGFIRFQLSTLKFEHIMQIVVYLFIVVVVEVRLRTPGGHKKQGPPLTNLLRNGGVMNEYYVCVLTTRAVTLTIF